jgi:hypothetical protein
MGVGWLGRGGGLWAGLRAWVPVPSNTPRNTFQELVVPAALREGYRALMPTHLRCC